MPKRVRAQRIEERSRAAFKLQATNASFQGRHSGPRDDGSVEEFDDRDRATGLRYFVQLKATDGDDLHEALKRSIPIEHANLYSSLTLPILMVRYIAARDELYVRWWHSPLPGQRPPRADAASLTFQWGPEDKFGEGGSGRFAEEARTFLEMRSAALPLPLFLALKIEAPPFRLTGAEIELGVKSDAAKRPDVIELRRDRTHARFIDRDRYPAVEMSGRIAASYDFLGDYDPGPGANRSPST